MHQPEPDGRRRLTRAQRLKRRADFLRVQGHGARVGTRHFVFMLAQGLQGQPSRLGVTATKKMGNAVARNRAKRLVREAYRQLPDLLPSGTDMVVVVRSALDGMKAQDVVQEWVGVARLLRRRAWDVLHAQREPEATG